MKLLALEKKFKKDLGKLREEDGIRAAEITRKQYGRKRKAEDEPEGQQKAKRAPKKKKPGKKSSDGQNEKVLMVS